MTFTLIFIAITVLVSIAAFNNRDLINKLILYPRIMSRPAEYYRLLSSGFIHADWNHLIFNMFTLYFFGRNAEYVLGEFFPQSAGIVFCVLYLSAIVISSLPSMIKHRDNSHYAALGASGGVSAILFFTIYYFPWAGIQIYFIPIGIPAIIYGVLYSAYSFYMAKKGNDNVGHDAHLGGGIYGFIFAFLVDPTHGRMFLEQITHPVFH